MAEYFDHTTNARNDEKILDMRIELGASGYGVWWMLLEKLAAEKDHMLELNIRRLAWDLREDEELIRKVIMDYGLFRTCKDEETGKELFWNERMESRMAHIEGVRKAKSEAGKASGESRRRIARAASEEPSTSEEEAVSASENGTDDEQMMNMCSTENEHTLNKLNKTREDKIREEKKKEKKKKNSSSILPGGEETESGAAEAAEEEEDMMEEDYWELTLKAQGKARDLWQQSKLEADEDWVLWKLARWLTTPKESDREVLTRIMAELIEAGRKPEDLTRAMMVADQQRPINPIPLPYWDAISYVMNLNCNDRTKIMHVVGRKQRMWQELLKAVKECDGNAKIKQPGRFVLSRLTI